MVDVPHVAVILRLRHPSQPAHLAIRSLLQQTRPARELVVAGIGARTVGAAIADPRTLRLTVDAGPLTWPAALNRAVAATEAPLIAFIDGNALATAERLDVQARFLSLHRQFGLAAAWSESLSLRGWWARHAYAGACPEKLMAFLLHENPFSFGTVMITRACFDAAGGFDEQLPTGADHDLWLRIGLLSRLAALPTVLCRYLPWDRHPRHTGDVDWQLPDWRRQRHVERLLQTSASGERILEEALSRYPEDDVLWACYARLGRPSGGPRGTAAPPFPLAGGGRDVGTRPDIASLYLKCLRHPGDRDPFNDLAAEYRRLGNPMLAYLCGLQSLALDPRQEAVFDQAYTAWTQGVPQATGFREADAGSGGEPCTVSVLLATRNRAHVIRESIQSVLDQTLRDWELVVVDDGSTDGTEEVIRSLHDARVRYVRTPHRGVPAAFNTAARHARGRYLAYLGDDDVFFPDHLARAVEALETSGASLVYTLARAVCGRYDKGTFLPELEVGPHCEPYDEDRLRRDCIIGALSAVHRRESLATVGGFDERLPVCEDWDLWIRISERFPVRYVDALTGEYRHHGGNMTAGNVFRGRLVTHLLQTYYSACHGLTILLRSAHLQGRISERDRLRHALRERPLAVGEDTYRDLFTLLAGMPGDAGLVMKLFAFRPRWYLRCLASRLRTNPWVSAAGIPVKLYPRLILCAIREGLRGGAFALSPFFWHRCRILAHELLPGRGP